MRDDRTRCRLQVLGFVFAIVPFVSACGADGDQHDEPRPEAPVTGVVRVEEGDCMPGLAPGHCRLRGLTVRVDAYPIIVVDERSREDRSRFRVPDGAVPTQTTTSDGEGRIPVAAVAGPEARRPRRELEAE